MTALLALIIARSGSGDGSVAIFSEPGFPHCIASSAVSPEFVQHCLTVAGIDSERLSAAQLGDAQRFNSRRFPVLAYLYGNTFPIVALQNLRRFHAERGCIVAFGGVPFCHPCVFQEGKWVDVMEELGWEFLSHRGMGTGLWGETSDVEAVVHAPGDPLGVAWMPLPPAPPGVVQFPRLGMTLADSQALGFDHLLGLPPEDRVIPVVSVTKGGAAVGHPVCIIEHHCPEFAGALDIWAGATLSPLFTMQQQEQLVVSACAYALQRAGRMTWAERRRVLSATRARFVRPLATGSRHEGPYLARAKPPARTLVVLDLCSLTHHQRMTALSLQGIVNRIRPRVYLIAEFKDRKWLRLLEQEGRQIEQCGSLEALVQRFRHEISGAVLYEPTQPFTANIATMVAATQSAVMATPELAERLGLDVVADLRGRFAGDTEAYEWALATLWPELEHSALACMEPTWEAPRDYLVQFRIFTFWLDCRCSEPLPPDQALFLERLLARVPPHAPVYGWWQHDDDGGIGEVRGVTTASRYAKVTVCTAGAYNLSVHSGVPLPELPRQQRIRFGSLDRKVYVSFIVSDGDNFGLNLYSVIGRLWEQAMRGRVPVGWGICPTQLELTPAAVRYWYQTATENDLFIAMDGIGYVYPDHYGSALGDAEGWYPDFLRLTRPYLERLDLQHLWFLGGSSRVTQMARQLRLDGLFGEYGVPPRQRQELVGDTAVIWVDVNPWQQPYAEPASYVNRIRERTPPDRPAFLLVGVNGFHIGPNEIARILQELGPEYIPVRPDELCHLLRKFRTSGVDPVPVSRPALDLTPPPPSGATVLPNGALVVRYDDNDPDISGWYTDPRGTQWVRKRLAVSLPPDAKQAKVIALVRGAPGNRVTFKVNGHQHTARLEAAGWVWVTATLAATELRSGENEVWYTGNPDGRLWTAGDSSSQYGRSEYGGPDHWTELAGELMCYLEVR